MRAVTSKLSKTSPREDDTCRGKTGTCLRGLSKLGGHRRGLGRRVSNRSIVLFRRTCTCITRSCKLRMGCLLSLSRRQRIDTKRMSSILSTIHGKRMGCVLTRRLCKGDVKSAVQGRSSTGMLCLSPLGHKACRGSDCVGNVGGGVRVLRRTFCTGSR